MALMCPPRRPSSSTVLLYTTAQVADLGQGGTRCTRTLQGMDTVRLGKTCQTTGPHLGLDALPCRGIRLQEIDCQRLRLHLVLELDVGRSLVQLRLGARDEQDVEPCAAQPTRASDPRPHSG